MRHHEYVALKSYHPGGQYENKLKASDACFSASGLAASQNIDGVPIVHLGRKGTIEFELECSGEYWNRGPTKRGIHSSLYAIVESPIWRLIQALSTMVDENDPTSQMQEIMKAMGQHGQQDIKPILEINPSHVIIKKMKNMRKSKSFDDISQLLLDQAVLLEGAKLQNPTEFVERLNTILTETL